MSLYVIFCSVVVCAKFFLFYYNVGEGRGSFVFEGGLVWGRVRENDKAAASRATHAAA